MSKPPGANKLFRSPIPGSEASKHTGALAHEDSSEIGTQPVPAMPTETPSHSSSGDLADRPTMQAPAVQPASAVSYQQNPASQAGIGGYNPMPAPFPVSQSGIGYGPGPAQPPVTPRPQALAGQSGNLNNMQRPPAAANAPCPNAFVKARRKYSNLSTRAKIVILAMLALLLLPSVFIVLESVNAFALYSQADSAIKHLEAAQNVFSGGGNSHGNLARYFDVKKLRQVQGEINAAHSDLVRLRDELDQDGNVAMLANMVPAQVGTARSLVHIGVDATEIGQIALQSAIKMAPTLSQAFNNPLNSGSKNTEESTAPLKPYLTSSNVDEIFADINLIIPHVHAMNMQARGLSLNTLPLSSKQSNLVGSLLKLLPAAEVGLNQTMSMKSEISWLLGADQPRTFLVEPMDRAELRATGGFTGQFGELSINGGHMSPLKLKNIAQFEEDITGEGAARPDQKVYGKVVGQPAPDPYNNWWPVGNFGMRDANLSADFPTSARLIMDRYNYEFEKKLDGVIIFTPALIEHVLHVTGPIHIAAYNETITEQNLEARLHYYQLDNTGIRREEIIEKVEDPQQARKLFTQQVTKTLMDTAQHLPYDKVLSLVNEMFLATKTKDLQIYFTNPKVNALITKYGAIASLDRSTQHDGLAIVQSNLSASKASQYVTTSIKDIVSLDASGGATHQMVMMLNYQKKGDVYGMSTYRDYVRIYVPPSSQLISSYGFAHHLTPYCGSGAGYQACAQDVYGDGTLVCTTAPVDTDSTSFLDYGAGFQKPIPAIGQLTNQKSDEPGRAMYAGWVVVPPNCSIKVTLSWYVPPSSHTYSLLFQPQASVHPQLDLTVKSAQKACAGSKPSDLHFVGTMDGQDRTFTLQTGQSGGGCALRMS
ncbi:DUF4012 domain-containing protein [Ktedonobacter sp. SOSP1-52]|uniref:DUF4012 domain-containing protein n=1 Tax=Ktedonobacter sp. SOSP1-52 TaxID=2778366 RepID=UPI001914EEBD|nr:DUF4012 domain-containing protein [Ktedonobacter sp. SOSP1-52]